MRWDPEFFWDFQSLGHRNPTWLNISWSDLVVTMAFSSHFHTMWSWRHVLRSWYWQVHLCGRSNFKSQYLGWRDKPPTTVQLEPRHDFQEVEDPLFQKVLCFSLVPAVCKPCEIKLMLSKLQRPKIHSLALLAPSCWLKVRDNLDDVQPRQFSNYRGSLESFPHHSQSGIPNPKAVVHFPLSENGWF